MKKVLFILMFLTLFYTGCEKQEFSEYLNQVNANQWVVTEAVADTDDKNYIRITIKAFIPGSALPTGMFCRALIVPPASGDKEFSFFGAQALKGKRLFRLVKNQNQVYGLNCTINNRVIEPEQLSYYDFYPISN